MADKRRQSNKQYAKPSASRPAKSSASRPEKPVNKSKRRDDRRRKLFEEGP